MRDIFVMRDVAREIDARNRVVEPDLPRELTAIERLGLAHGLTADRPIAHGLTADRPLAHGLTAADRSTSDERAWITHCVRLCGSRLTLADYGPICRQCLAGAGGQDYGW